MQLYSFTNVILQRRTNGVAFILYLANIMMKLTCTFVTNLLPSQEAVGSLLQSISIFSFFCCNDLVFLMYAEFTFSTNESEKLVFISFIQFKISAIISAVGLPNANCFEM